MYDVIDFTLPDHWADDDLVERLTDILYGRHHDMPAPQQQQQAPRTYHVGAANDVWLSWEGDHWRLSFRYGCDETTHWYLKKVLRFVVIELAVVRE